MIAPSVPRIAFALSVIALLGTAPANAQEPWADDEFLTDYSKLKPMPGKGGKDFAYVAPETFDVVGKYARVMLDQPEVFISPASPYKGAKPEDVAAIAGLIRSTTAAALQERGYKIVDQPGGDTAYVRMAVTDLQIVKKKRGLLAYTPVGFVVDAGVKALRDFMDKYDILDMSLQVEVQDSVKHDVLAAAVIQRGQSADATKPIEFDAMVAVANELGERFACRLDMPACRPSSASTAWTRSRARAGRNSSACDALESLRRSPARRTKESFRALAAESASFISGGSPRLAPAAQSNRGGARCVARAFNTATGFSRRLIVRS